MLAWLGGLWNKAELIWSGLAKPVSCNGLSETHGLVWSGLVKSGDLDPGGSLVWWSARENWINLRLIYFCLKCSVNHNESNEN